MNRAWLREEQVPPRVIQLIQDSCDSELVLLPSPWPPRLMALMCSAAIPVLGYAGLRRGKHPQTGQSPDWVFLSACVRGQGTV